MRFLISSEGSHGDMLPFCSLGAQLRSRGHEVALFGNAHFAPFASAAGIDFIASSDAALRRELLDDERMTQSRSGLQLMSRLLAEHLEPSYQLLRQRVLPGRTALIGSTLAFSAHLLAETHRLPFAVLHLSPSVLRSDHLAPRLTRLGHFESWPRVFKRSMWKLMDAAALDPLFTQPLNRLRVRLGLPPVRRIFHRWLHDADLVLGLFPEWFAPRQPDWPERMVLAGFPARVMEGPRPLPAEVAAFLGAGDPPIVFTAGTANTTSQRFYQESAAACVRLGRRGVLVAQEAAQVPQHLPASVCHTRWAPFDTLLPRAAALVHHGGIGTTAAALRAGVPQIIQPMAYDQFDNASRALRLNTARELLPGAYRADRLARLLGQALSDRELQAACLHWAQAMKDEDGVAVACHTIEEALVR